MNGIWVASFDGSVGVETFELPGLAVGGAALVPKAPWAMSVPEGLTREHHRDLAGRERRPHVRHVLLGMVCAVLLLGLLNIFGQTRNVDVVETEVARFEVSAPTKLRGGLFFEARYKIDAVREIANATIVLDPGWLEDITLNTVAPAPARESSRDGKIALGLGRVPAGEKHVLFLHFQVNPTAVGIRSQDVELYDGDRLLASFDRDAIVWP
jgi:hypothetical protein